MGNCKDCKYWKHITSDFGESWDECTVDHLGDPWEELRDGCASMHVEAHDNSGLEARLVTSPNFGCTMFKEK